MDYHERTYRIAKLVSIPIKPALQGWFFHIWAKGYDLMLKIATILSSVKRNYLHSLRLKNHPLRYTKAPITNGGSNNFGALTAQFYQQALRRFAGITLNCCFFNINCIS